MELVISQDGKAQSVGTIALGDEGVAQTIAAMQAIIDVAVFGARSRPLIAAVAKQLRPEDGPEEFGARLYAWCQSRITFKKDPASTELIRTPSEIIATVNASGKAECDCDCLAVLACSIIAVAGYRPVLITVGRTKQGRFEHVYFGIRRGDGLAAANVLPLDPQERTPIGQWSPKGKRVRLWSVTVTKPAGL